MQLRLSSAAPASRDETLSPPTGTVPRRARAARYWMGVAPGGAPFWATATAAVDW